MSAQRTLMATVLRNPVGLAAVAWLLLASLAMIAAPWITAYDPLEQDLFSVLAKPSMQHFFGADSLGRDVFSRALYGGRSTLIAATEALAVYLAMGVTLGLMAGYLGGRVDWAISRFAELLIAMPTIIIVLVVLAVFPGNMDIAMGTIGFIASAGLIRILRAQAMAYREELYVAAAAVAGLTRGQIMMRHIAPRVMSTIIVQGSLLLAAAVSAQAGLGFLGFGAPPPEPSWGGLINDASQVISRAPWMLVTTGGPLIITVLALGLLGDVIRDAAVRGWSAPKLVKAPRVVSATETAVPAGDALLSVRDLKIEIGGQTMVDGVSFDLMPGEALGIVGESGCGKSVTVMGLLGLVPGGGRISGGKVVLNGVDLTANPKALDGMRGTALAYVSQDPMVALDPMFTVRSQLLEALGRHRPQLSAREAKSRVLELLSMAGIPDPTAIAARRPYQLSGGLAQRVSIALALAGEPELLICDEPTTALDVSVQAEILALLHRLRAETGMAIVIVTHDWGVVADLCNRALVMYAGQVVEQANVVDLFVHPLHPYTAGLLAANPHLAVEGEPIRTIPGVVPRPIDWPMGCRFAERCPYVTDQCRATPVEMAMPAPHRESRCLHFDLLLAEGDRA